MNGVFVFNDLALIIDPDNLYGDLLNVDAGHPLFFTGCINRQIDHKILPNILCTVDRFPFQIGKVPRQKNLILFTKIRAPASAQRKVGVFCCPHQTQFPFRVRLIALDPGGSEKIAGLFRQNVLKGPLCCSPDNKWGRFRFIGRYSALCFLQFRGVLVHFLQYDTVFTHKSERFLLASPINKNYIDSCGFIFLFLYNVLAYCIDTIPYKIL